jgi:hypothetical protein
MGLIFGGLCWMLGLAAILVGLTAHYGLVEASAPMAIRIIMWVLTVSVTFLCAAGGSHIMWCEYKYNIKKFLGLYK